ncbi:Hypothetical predicted protein [Pelobates cultripes]|uniref:Uncharacterized protein n=1 Tax=Pelobates cultripes TaxID=61616 RepID=A0AAD1SZ85_PELCU|nr:Hypothetical predicted protein [Pelobates cultripes]
MADMPSAPGNQADLGSPNWLECITDRFDKRQVPRHGLHPGRTRTRHARQVTGGGCGDYTRAVDQSALDYAGALGRWSTAIWDSIHRGSVHRDCMKWPCRGIG